MRMKATELRSLSSTFSQVKPSQESSMRESAGMLR